MSTIDNTTQYHDEIVVNTPAGVYALDAAFTVSEAWELVDATPCFRCDYEGHKCTHMECVSELNEVELVGEVTITGTVYYFTHDNPDVGYPLPVEALTGSPHMMSRVREAVLEYAKANAAEPEYEEYLDTSFDPPDPFEREWDGWEP